ncbi:MAG: restriction endonuclease subunit S [Spirochaetales bacterium]|nr:restriction endonuclease subunit S [Spirochaetales bacterium]
MKRYDSYTESGVEWIGEIPGYWEVKKVKHRCYVKARVGWKGLKSDEFLTNGYAYLVTGQDFKYDRVIWEECYHIDKDRYDEDPYIQLKENDLLITKDGTIGKLAIVKKLDKPACLNSGIFVVRPKNSDFSADFLLWLLKSHSFSQFNDYTSYGSTIQHLYQNIFVEFSFPFPPLPEQTAIAAYLDRKTAEIDELIAGKKRLLELYEEEKTAIINQAVTKGLDPGVRMKDSGIEWLGEIPGHWEVKKIRYCCQILRGRFTHRPRNDEKLYGGIYPFIQTGEIARAGKYVTEYSQTLNALGYAVTNEFPAGTLLMTIAANIGEVAILGFNACFPDSIVGFYPNSEIHNEFLYYKLKSMKEAFLSTSVLNTQLNLNIERIREVAINYPPLEEQQSIVRHIETECSRIDARIERTRTLIDLLTEYRTTLISEVVTGKIKVTE